MTAFTSFGRPLIRADRLICFPYAGGNAHQFRAWAGRVEGADVVAAQLRGRGSRYADPAETDFTRLVDELVGAIEPWLSARTTLFGHSMGGLLAFEVARRLAAEGRPPRLVVVAGCPAPAEAGALGERDLSDAALVDELARGGVVAPEVLAHSGLLKLLLPTLRADLQVVASYRPPVGHPYEGAVDLYYGREDLESPACLRRGWRDYVAGPLGTAGFPGGHFFVVHHRDEVLGRLRQDIGAS